MQNKITLRLGAERGRAISSRRRLRVTDAAAVRERRCRRFPRFHHQCPGKEAYPISSFTWLLIPAQAKDANKGKIIVDFLNWMVTDGQKMTMQLSYAPLPQNVAEKVKAAIKQIH